MGRRIEVKSSYGIQGNDAIGLYRYTVYLLISALVVFSAFESKGTKDITHGNNANFNVGLNFALKNEFRVA